MIVLVMTGIVVCGIVLLDLSWRSANHVAPRHRRDS